MKDLRLVIDLESYIDSIPGLHPIVTGTYDPGHIQHTAPMVMSQQTLARMGITNPYIVIPHSRNTKKNPVASLDERRRWIMETVDFFADEIAHRVKLCVGMGEADEPYIYDLPVELQRRMVRIAGSDKNGEITQGVMQTLFVKRDIDMSSTKIRELMRLTGSHPDLRLALAPKVLEEILAKGYYKKSV